MLVRFLSLAVGPDFAAHPGQMVEVADDLGAALIEGHFAEPVDGDGKAPAPKEVEAPEVARKDPKPGKKK